VNVYITGVGGLIGSTVAEEAVKRGHRVWGCDNDNRGKWFGVKGSTGWRCKELANHGVTVHACDFRFAPELVQEADLIVHCASQPSHDWSRANPIQDSLVNYMGTVELLEATRRMSPGAVFVFMSTNKVYGDVVNSYEYSKNGDRDEPANRWMAEHGVHEFHGLDRSLHTPFGVSKTAADLMVQEFRRCYGLQTVCFRCGCLTGSGGTAVEMQGFLGWLVKKAVAGEKYTVYGWGGYQVRDNIDATDVADAVFRYAVWPKGSVYNMGGGYCNAISIREAVSYLRDKHSLDFDVDWDGPARVGDHHWWVTDTKLFEDDYRGWRRKSVYEVIDAMVIGERRSREPEGEDATLSPGFDETSGIQ
jgi:CDP-paratose 2-epimerase